MNKKVGVQTANYRWIVDLRTNDVSCERKNNSETKLGGRLYQLRRMVEHTEWLEAEKIIQDFLEKNESQTV